MTVRAGITGAAGRMGRMLIEAISDSDMAITVGAAIERPGSSLVGADVGELIGRDATGIRIVDDLAAVIGEIDVLIDFTQPEATVANAALCAGAGVAMVIGTTGLSDEQDEQLQRARRALPCAERQISPPESTSPLSCCSRRRLCWVMKWMLRLSKPITAIRWMRPRGLLSVWVRWLPQHSSVT